MMVWLLEEKLSTLLESGDIASDSNMLSELKEPKLESETCADALNVRSAIIYRLQQKKIIAEVLQSTMKYQEQFMAQEHIKQLVNQLQILELENGDV